MSDALDVPVWSALTGAHSHLAEVVGGCWRYPLDVSIFNAVDPDDDGAWADLRGVIADGGFAALVGQEPPEGAGLEVVFREDGYQLVLDREPRADPLDDVVELTEDDWEDMAALVRMTDPGPWGPRTPLLGTYLGVKRDGRLVAMAGERLHSEGATEISAVCTHPDVRRQGLAAQLTAEVARRIQARGERPFLHTTAANESARSVYRALGFEERRRIEFVGVVATQMDRSPPAGSGDSVMNRDLEFGEVDPSADDVRAIRQAHLDFARSVTPPEGVFALTLDEVDPDVTFHGARLDGVLVGIVALRPIEDGHVELKSMHTVATSRGQGVARALLDHVLDVAAGSGAERVSLETGNMDAFEPSRALYRSAGFEDCPPWGDYVGSATSHCMTRRL